MNIPEGWPTREMINAAWHEIFGKSRLDANGTEIVTYALTAALAAAPTPPAPQSDKLRKAAEEIISVCDREHESVGSFVSDLIPSLANLRAALEEGK